MTRYRFDWFSNLHVQAKHQLRVSRRMRILVIGTIVLVLGIPKQEDFLNTPQLRTANSGTQSMKRAHIVYAANKDQITGVYASVCSILKNTLTPDAITIHLFIIQNDTDILNDGAFDAFQDYVQGMEATLELHDYSPSDVKPFINMKFSEQSSRGNLATPSNYVRFIVSDRLPHSDLCLWIDADTIVKGDIVPFMNNRDHTKFVSAFRREKADIDDNVRAKLQSRGVDLAPSKPTFNAGIMVMNLKLLRETNASAKLANICKLNDELSLWTNFGSQPPLQLLFSGDRFEHLPSTLYANALGYIQDYEVPEQAMFLHWNGRHKPWLRDGFNTKYWEDICGNHLTGPP